VIALDTNILVRLLVQDDAEQARRARRLVDECLATGERCLVSLPVLCELEWVLETAYRASREQVAAAVRTLMTTPPFHLEEPDVVNAALRAYSKGRGGLPDHLVGGVARARGSRTTYTFDRDLRRVEGFSLL
jgi:predicted nucleic-acid-binding protein